MSNVENIVINNGPGGKRKCITIDTYLCELMKVRLDSPGGADGYTNLREWIDSLRMAHDELNSVVVRRAMMRAIACPQLMDKFVNRS